MQPDYLDVVYSFLIFPPQTSRANTKKPNNSSTLVQCEQMNKRRKELHNDITFNDFFTQKSPIRGGKGFN